MKDKIICLIIARGGSKSLPNKNIIKINKIPLIAYSILQAKQIKFIQRVIVSTDSEKIMKISKKFGAEILFKRPKKISGDLSTDFEVFEHAINWLKKYENYKNYKCSCPKTYEGWGEFEISYLPRLCVDCPIELK